MSHAPNPKSVRWIVWSIWAAMTLAALGFVARFGSNVPFWDEWGMVDFAIGARPVTLEWLWTPHNGHRVLIPKLLLIGLYKLSGTDFRAGMYFNVMALAGAAAALIWASRYRRDGKMLVTDAIFPLLLLHWGHYENLLWSWQATFVLPVVAVCGVLAIIVAYGVAPPLWAVALATAGVITLPLSGVPGLAYAPALACWTALAGAAAYRHAQPRRAIFLWAAVTVTMVLASLYFYKYANSSGPVSIAQPVAVLKTAVRFTACGLGPGTVKFWPMSAVATAVLLVTAVTLIAAVVQRDHWPRRELALLLFLTGGACLLAAFAAARTGTGIVGRYFLLATPMWCAAFLAWPYCAGPAGARWAQIAFLGAVLALMPVNVSAGVRYAEDYHRRMERFRADLRAGMSPNELVAHHIATLCPCPWWLLPETGIKQAWGNLSRDDGFPVANVVSFADPIANSLRNLRDRHIGDFVHIRADDPEVREIAPSLASGFTISRALPEEHTSVLNDPAVLLTPDRPLYLAGIRVRRPSTTPSAAPTTFEQNCVQVFWRSPGEPTYMAPNRYVFFWEPGQGEQTVWIFQFINQIALHVGDHNAQRRLGPEEMPVILLLPARTNENLQAGLNTR